MNEEILDKIRTDKILPDNLRNSILKSLKSKDIQTTGVTFIPLPIDLVKDDDYLHVLEIAFTCFQLYLNKHPYYSADEMLMNEINENCNCIINAIKNYLTGDIALGIYEVTKILEKFKDKDPSIFITDLDGSYAFRQMAPFKELHTKGYDKVYKEMNNATLTFYRARVDKVYNVEDMLHIPFNMRHKVSTQRYGVPGIPCLYLGATSYVCWLETGEVPNHKFYVSCFIPKNEAKKLKILNMVYDETVISGIFMSGVDGKNKKLECLQKDCLLMWPLLCATSFGIKEEGRVFKTEYIISHLIMYAMKQLKIDGVAYSSIKDKEYIKTPHAVNIAFPMYERTGLDNYGEVCNFFKVGKPIGMEEFKNISKDEYKDNLHESYINKYYSKDKNDCLAKVPYGGTMVTYANLEFSKLDNYLMKETQGY